MMIGKGHGPVAHPLDPPLVAKVHSGEEILPKVLTP